MLNSKTMTARSKKKIGDYFFVYGMLILPLASFAVFFLYKTIQSLLLGFQSYNLRTGEYEWNKFENFKYIFTSYSDPQRKTAAWNTFFNMFHAWPINLIIAPIIIIVAFSFYKKIRFEKFFRVAFMMPGIVSVLVTTMAWQYLFDYDFGPLAALVSKIAGKEIIFMDTSQNYMWYVIYAYCIWSGLGSNLIMIAGAMIRIPSEIQDAGMIDGVSFFQELWYIVLPLCMGTLSIYFVAIISAPLSFGMSTRFLVPNAGPDNKYYSYAWMMFDSMLSANPQNLTIAAAWGMLYTVLWFPLMTIGRKLLAKVTPDIDF